MSALLQRKKMINDMIWQARAMILFFEDQINDLDVQIIHEQAVCIHNPLWYAEGRHGSDKGTMYYRCTKCGFEWEE